MEKFLVTTLECLRDDDFHVLFIKRYFHTYKISQRINHSLLKSSKHLPKNPKTLGGENSKLKKKNSTSGEQSLRLRHKRVLKKEPALKGIQDIPGPKLSRLVNFELSTAS